MIGTTQNKTGLLEIANLQVSREENAINERVIVKTDENNESSLYTRIRRRKGVLRVKIVKIRRRSRLEVLKRRVKIRHQLKSGPT